MTVPQVVIPIRMPRALYEDLGLMAKHDERTRAAMLRKVLGAAIRRWRGTMGDRVPQGEAR